MTESSAITIQPVSRPVRGRIRPPGSKSITNRALVCAALASGTSTLTGALDSEDTRVMIECLRELGVAIESRDDGQTLVVHGCGGDIPATSADLFVGNSGTTIRFLTAVCALGHGTYRLDGVERMRERPMGDLVETLRQLGVDVQCERKENFPPIVVRGSGLAGEVAEIRGRVSSQFLSGVLMAAPYADSRIGVLRADELVSKPYVNMTIRVMKDFGVSVESRGSSPIGNSSIEESLGFEISPQTYTGRDYWIEPDASAASYFWAAAAITGGEVTVEGLAEGALQGDVKFVDCLEEMGCEVQRSGHGITVSGRAQDGGEFPMGDISDTVQTLAAVALFTKGPTTIRGVGHIRHKETDRIRDLARELRKFGAVVVELDDGLKIVPPEDIRQRRDVTIETYNDHRMAMSLALTGLVLPGITILNPGCTAKTYPRFFEDLAALVNAS